MAGSRRARSRFTCSSRRWATPAARYVAMFLHERQSAWLQGLEGAFRALRWHDPGGLDRQRQGTRAHEHDARPARSTFNDRFHAFCRYWGVRRGRARRTVPGPRARTSAAWATSSATPSPVIASRAWKNVQAHLARWMREVADVRVHGTTAEPPIDRFERDERGALARWPARRRSCRCASSAAAFTPTPASSSTPTATACRGADRRERHRRRRPSASAGAVRRSAKWPATRRALVGAHKRDRARHCGHRRRALVGVSWLARPNGTAAPGRRRRRPSCCGR